MKIFKLIITLIFLNISLSVYSSENPEFQVKIEKAISLAREYVQSNKIDVSGHFIGSSEFNFRSGLDSFWRIEWRMKKLVKGGQIIVNVYENGKIDHAFGE